uniref:Uncharacterized protein n=1 Tax=Setaria viridis TaxID=4556 RepID=A0A4V6D857_SETVI|nr:hypothetical protein SEVIR_4G109600v2 [Setaria viridis]
MNLKDLGLLFRDLSVNYSGGIIHADSPIFLVMLKGIAGGFVEQTRHPLLAQLPRLKPSLRPLILGLLLNAVSTRGEATSECGWEFCSAWPLEAALVAVNSNL